jgi:hypothetical protein
VIFCRPLPEPKHLLRTVRQALYRLIEWAIVRQPPLALCNCVFFDSADSAIRFRVLLLQPQASSIRQDEARI